MLMHDSKRDVANLLHEESDTRSVREFFRRKQQQQSQQKQNKQEGVWDLNEGYTAEKTE